MKNCLQCSYREQVQHLQRYRLHFLNLGNIELSAQDRYVKLSVNVPPILQTQLSVIFGQSRRREVKRVLGRRMLLASLAFRVCPTASDQAQQQSTDFSNYQDKAAKYTAVRVYSSTFYAAVQVCSTFPSGCSSKRQSTHMWVDQNKLTFFLSLFLPITQKNKPTYRDYCAICVTNVRRIR